MVHATCFNVDVVLNLDRNKMTDVSNDIEIGDEMTSEFYYISAMLGCTLSLLGSMISIGMDNFFLSLFLRSCDIYSHYN